MSAKASTKPTVAKKAAAKPSDGQPVPLSGGNPQIAKGRALLPYLRDGQWDEALLADWIRQASALPGWAP